LLSQPGKPSEVSCNPPEFWEAQGMLISDVGKLCYPVERF
jgi:hypothetical protein